MCNHNSDTISSHDRSFAAHRNGCLHTLPPLRTRALSHRAALHRIPGCSASSHARAYDGSRDPRARARAAPRKWLAQRGWSPVWPPATAAAPLHRVRSPISITTIATPMVGQEEGLSALPMTCEGCCAKSEAREAVVWGACPRERRERAAVHGLSQACGLHARAPAWHTCRHR